MKNFAKHGIVACIFITGFLFHFNCLAQESNWLVMSWWDELFEIVTFEEDEAFHEFHKVFGIYPDDNYRLDRVKEICLYINWGDAGVAGSGTVV